LIEKRITTVPKRVRDNHATAVSPNVATSLAATRLRLLNGVPPGVLVVNEIYRSIQGESTFAGMPCVFVRLAACHLRCVYCDTAHAFQNGRRMATDEVVAEALGLGDSLIEITGGEPLLQPECLPLIERLCDAGKTVLIETSGSLDISGIDPRARVILDLKTPSSGELGANDWANLSRLKSTDEVKFVIGDRADFEWTLDMVRKFGLTDRLAVLVGAVYEAVAPADLAAWILESRLPLRFQIQLHKQIWDPNARGV
jgi:7-carboxy-7-deazaguanine synthase